MSDEDIAEMLATFAAEIDNQLAAYDRNKENGSGS